MASLFKFKLLPTHCGVAHSPRTSPLLHLRRRKTTLRMLLTSTSARRSPRRRPLPDKNREHHRKDFPRTSTLKDLFVSSPPYEATDGEIHDTAAAAMTRSVTPVRKVEDGLVGSTGWQSGSPRPGWSAFRYKYLLRKTWRPVLAGIPE